MKRPLIAVLICAWLGTIAISALEANAQEKPPATDVNGNIKWVFDYDEGKQISKKTGKPIFVVFRCER